MFDGILEALFSEVINDIVGLQHVLVVIIQVKWQSNDSGSPALLWVESGWHSGGTFRLGSPHRHFPSHSYKSHSIPTNLRSIRVEFKTAK
jgi:hypothetical protein